MRLYLSVGYNTKKMGLSMLVGELIEEGLVGYGYDIAPTLTYFKVHLLFFHLTIGNLSNFK